MDETFTERFWAKVDKSQPNDCWLWQGAKNKEGYGSINDPRFNKHRRAHVIAYELSTGDIVQKGLIVMHLCDNPQCCNPNHLRKGTQKENIWDSINKKRREIFPNRLIGEKCYNAKLKENEVHEIKQRLRNGESPTEIARSFHVSRGAVTNIRLGVTWKSLGEKP